MQRIYSNGIAVFRIFLSLALAYTPTVLFGQEVPLSLGQVTPMVVIQGDRQMLSLPGEGIQEGAVIQIPDAQGVTIRETHVVRDTLFRFIVLVESDASVGWRSIELANPDGSSDRLDLAFRVRESDSDNPPDDTPPPPDDTPPPPDDTPPPPDDTPPPPSDDGYTFTDVTEFAGVADDRVDHFGVTFSDYDKDGWLDIYTANGSNGGPGDPEDLNQLYRNNGDGTFSNVTEQTQTADPWVAMRNVWADYDRDGDLDFYSHNFMQSTLYQNNGNVFTDVNQQSGAGLTMSHGTGAAWGDIDNDGWLDLHAVGFVNGENALLHNNGDGTFTDIQASAGLPLQASGMGNALVDYDRDGFLDISQAAVTATDGNFLYRNNGDLTFTPVTSSAGIVVEPGASGSAITWADYDGDGWLDFAYTEVELGSEKTLPRRIYLFRNRGDGTFEDVTGSAGLVVRPEAIEFWHASWADYNNDGHPDLFVGADGPNSFFRNNGDGTFTDVAPELGLDLVEEGKGGAWGDFDNDGDVDLYVLQKSQPGQPLVPNVLFRNEGGTNNWLQVELFGTCANLDAIGARITVQTASGRMITREIDGGTGFFDQHTPIQQFGLAGETEATLIGIRWPGGGLQELTNVAANQRITVTEPDTCSQ